MSPNCNFGGPTIYRQEKTRTDVNERRGQEPSRYDTKAHEIVKYGQETTLAAGRRVQVVPSQAVMSSQSKGEVVRLWQCLCSHCKGMTATG